MKLFSHSTIRKCRKQQTLLCLMRMTQIYRLNVSMPEDGGYVLGDDSMMGKIRLLQGSMHKQPGMPTLSSLSV